MPLQLHQGKGAGLSGSTEGSAVASLWPAPAPPAPPTGQCPNEGHRLGPGQASPRVPPCSRVWAEHTGPRDRVYVPSTPRTPGQHPGPACSHAYLSSPLRRHPCDGDLLRLSAGAKEHGVCQVPGEG